MTHKPLALLLAIALLWLCSACTPEVRTTPTPAIRTTDGVITSVTADSLIEWTSMTIREPSGQELRFLRGNGVDQRFWRASHLREHITFGDLMRVTYEETPQGLVAESISHAST